MYRHSAKEQNIRFNQLYRRQSNLYHTYAAAHHLSDAAFSILYCLCETIPDERETAPYTQHGLAQLCSLPRQTVNSAISSLVRQGYVRLQQLPGSGNTNAVFLTDEGESLCRHVIDPLIEAEQRSLAQMGHEEVELYLRFSLTQLDLFEQELAAILPDKNGSSRRDHLKNEDETGE